ncbi:cobyrinic acid a,c-diamide synthase [Candidatus Magnetobacterium bavaricum]|uniref:Cobyrinate a,c-diamide synthase n=1 Tax=Candidatus Magnetobacterium bavaricum TaxID=29290 RepID=A0A0F3GSR5_9BACT|nr:cobyrinic acid a,c-diamide synthase [Candidatus Magnetobacterium bavaricum]
MKHAFAVAAIQSGTGKTTLSLGLMSALGRMGLRVAPFKVGPDFIDPGLHRVVTGRTSYNLDTWMCDADYVRGLFYDKSTDADVAIAEGVMGLFDGEHSSTAAVARLLSLPVVLVLDVRGMAQSAAAIVAGVGCIDPELSVAGVILNRVGSDRHTRLVRDAIELHCNTKVLGGIPFDADAGLAQRHLGLFTAEDGCLNVGIIERLTRLIQENVDLDALLTRTGRCSENTACVDTHQTPTVNLESAGGNNTAPLRIAVARDNAFCFYYEDNLEMLQRLGMTIVSFSPLNDERLPRDIDGLYLGGGYPELYAGRLSANTSMLESIRGFVASGGVTYAECGGFMYLMEGVTGLDGVFYPMAGVFAVRAVMRDRRVSLGYRQAVLRQDTIIGKQGDVVRGHEFHYSEVVDMPHGIRNVLETPQRTQGAWLAPNCLASYIHLHFAGNPNIIARFDCMRYKERKGLCPPLQNPLQ